MSTTFIVLLIFAYLLGSLNSAIIVCKCFGLPSPHSVGSGNPGATNVLRLGSKKAAAVTFLGDALKGVVPVVVAHYIALPMVELAWIGLVAVLGHMFPLFFRFKGGKGVATSVGVLLAVQPALGVAFMLTWLLVAGVLRFSSLAALCATVLTPVYGVWLCGRSVLLPLVILAAVILWRHRGNILRLCTGQESRIGQKAS